METTTFSKKRGLLSDMMPERSSSKRVKIEPNVGIFAEDKIPEGKFHIGESVFVYPNTFRGNVTVHIRRFKKYGNTFYPTKDGVTLNPCWTEFIMRPGALPSKPKDLRGGFFMKPEECKIESEDFETFTFSRFQTTKNDEKVTKSITISSAQWLEMKRQYNEICVSVLDHVYGSMDFFHAYISQQQGETIEDSLPDSLDVSLGTKCVSELLHDSVYECIKEKGKLKDPEYYAEELWATKVEHFNSAAFAVDLSDIVDIFYYRLWADENFLSLSKPAFYVTTKFLNELCLQDVLREVRDVFCPPETHDFYQDHE